jgi:hypothetical protein
MTGATDISRKYAADLYIRIQCLVFAAEGTMPDDERHVMTLDALARATGATLTMLGKGDPARTKLVTEGFAKTLVDYVKEKEDI